jgi:3-isopropylmalate/(R)-2-methylmalate dehydratase small subunit
VPELEPIRRIVSKATPLPLSDLDTDVITPMPRVMDGRFVEFAFEPLRFGPGGAPRAGCPLDDPAYDGAEILVAGPNFGCGSSRETAVWAVKGLGFRAVIAPSFGDIFRSNCFRNGLVPVALPGAAVDGLVEDARAGRRIAVDVERLCVESGGRVHAFELPELRRSALLEGLSDLELALRLEEPIAAFEAKRARERPWTSA